MTRTIKLHYSYDIETTDKWYDHDPTAVTESDEDTILWDVRIPTVNTNRPDIVIKDKPERRCKIIDIPIPSDNNTFVKVVEKLSKFKNLEIEISRMWGIRTDTTSGDRSFRTCEERTGKIHQQYPKQHERLRNPEDCHPWNSAYVAETAVD